MVERPDYDTAQVLNYCAPASTKELSQMLKERWNTSQSFFVTSAMQKRRVVAKLAMVKHGWLPILISGNIAIIVGYVYLLALDKVALQLVFACELLVTLGS